MMNYLNKQKLETKKPPQQHMFEKSLQEYLAKEPQPRKTPQIPARPASIQIKRKNLKRKQHQIKIEKQ